MAGRPASYNFLTPEKRAQFLALLSECGNVTRAAEKADLDRCRLYQSRRDDNEFAAEWEEAAIVGAARLEDEARRRAVEGWEEPVWHRGEMCGTVRKFSDTLLICLLKAHHPDKYKERTQSDANVTHRFEDMSDDELDAAIARKLGQG